MRFNKRVTDYWFRYYVSPASCGHLCSLCANGGIIDTRGVNNAEGENVGRLNFCICPNGQALRKSTLETIPSQA